MKSNYIVAIYDTYSAWGGSLDDGAWYFSGILVRLSRSFPDWDSARNYAVRMNDTFINRIRKQNDTPCDGTYKNKYQTQVYKNNGAIPKFLNMT